jgi:hypothetical protein
VVEELVLAIVPFDPHARPIADTYRALIVRAVMPNNALADLETLDWVGVIALTATLPFSNGEPISLISAIHRGQGR